MRAWRSRTLRGLCGDRRVAAALAIATATAIVATHGYSRAGPPLLAAAEHDQAAATAHSHLRDSMRGGLNAEADLMRAGVDALYARRDPAAATADFRLVLRQNPHHYGATFQLARALDLARDYRAAQAWWEKILDMAEAIDDEDTARAARSGLEGDLMETGLDALYARHNPLQAARDFRGILRLDPEQYGATFQLARALDIAGKPQAARTWWKKMLPMAEAARDGATVRTVQMRLRSNP